MEVIELVKKVLKRNDAIAENNRKLFKQKGIFALNLLSSPGAGKTSLLERVCERLQDKIEIGIIVGDVETENDARRLSEYNIQTVQIITNGACHLDAKMVKNALVKIDLDKINVLFIENVGNLVCPSNYDLGEEMRIVVVSTTEGDDKPLKYPPMFYSADIVIINKIDLLPNLPSDIAEMRKNLLKIKPNLKIFETSAYKGIGIDELCDLIILTTKDTKNTK